MHRTLQVGASVSLVLAALSHAFDRTIDGELSQLLSSLPSKGDDANTVSRRFRRDLVEFCLQGGTCGGQTIAELGCHRGHTTAVLARLFARVFVLDNSAQGLAAARARNKDRTNVVYLRVEHYNGLQRFDWPALLKENVIDVVFVDASHFYPHVVSDIRSALSLSQVHTLIFDDYALLTPVRKAVDDFIREDLLRCEGIGEDLKGLEELGGDVLEAQNFWGTGVPSMDHDSSIREGLVCAVARDVNRNMQVHDDGRTSILAPSAWAEAVLGTHFACHRLAMLGGSAPPLLEFVIIFSSEDLRVFWADPARSSEALQWRASSSLFRMSILGDVPVPLTHDLVFDSTLRTGFFLADERPDVFCVASDDLTRFAQWASARISP